MKLDWAMLCTAAEARDGLAYIIGGGWDTTGRGEFPSVFVGGIVIRLQFRPEEMGGHQLRLAAETRSGSQSARPSRSRLMWICPTTCRKAGMPAHSSA